MTFERLTAPATGERVQYDADTGEFSAPETPIIPFAYDDAVGESAVSATRRVLDAAAEEMGRTIGWMRVPVGTATVDSEGTALPPETVRAFERFRLGLLGPCSTATDGDQDRDQDRDLDLAVDLRRRLSLTTEMQPISHLAWTPSPVSTRDDLDVVCFRDITEDAAAGLEFEGDSPGGARMRTLLDTEAGGGSLGSLGSLTTGPVGFGVRPTTRAATERLVERATEYALDRDRNRLTVVHQGDRHPATEGAFKRWAMAFLDAEYSEAIVSAAAFNRAGASYPDDELVVGAQHTDDVCRGLLTSPEEYDVLVAPAGAGGSVSTVASEAVGGSGVTPWLYAGDGRAIVGSSTGRLSSGPGADEVNPIATIRAGCLLFELLGWDDVLGVVHDALEATLAEGLVTRDLARRTARSEVVTTDAFADRVIDHIRVPTGDASSSGVRTTAEERSAIKGTIAGLYNAIFEDHIRPTDLTLNQLRDEDEEADVYLPEIGINFREWRRWSSERRLEVLLHEFAHVEDYDDGHAPSFYDRLVELTLIAEDWQAELEVCFDDSIDFELVKRLVVESVHEETVEPEIESVEERKQALCTAFGLTSDEHY